MDSPLHPFSFGTDMDKQYENVCVLPELSINYTRLSTHVSSAQLLKMNFNVTRILSISYEREAFENA